MILLLVTTWLSGILGFAPSHAQTGPPLDSLATGPATATRDPGYSMTFRGAPLANALERIAATTQISLVYDTDLVDDKTVYCTASDASPDVLLSCVLRGHGLDFVRTSSGTYVLITAARKAPRRGRLAGVVVDAQTGEPLPHASVLLVDASTGTATDDSGLFQFTSLVAGPHKIVVTYLGYAPYATEVRVPPGGSTRQRIALAAQPIATEPVIVDGLQQRLPSGGLGHVAHADDDLQRPSATGTPDVARLASSGMGVTTRSPLADLHIQGSSNGEHQLRLDGAPVRNPASLGRLISAFSPLAIGRVTTHKAGFGASHGSYLSGVIELEHDLRRRGSQYATASADPVSFNGRAQGPFRLGGVDATAMGAARVGVWSLYRDPALEDLIRDWSILDPVLTAAWLGDDPDEAPSSLGASQAQPTAQFYDVHAAARFELSPYQYLHVSGYRGASSLGSSLLLSSALTPPGGEISLAPASALRTGTEVVPTYDRYDWTNTVAQARYERLVGARAIGTLRGTLSRYVSASSFEVGPAQELNSVSEPSASDADAILDESEPSATPNEENLVNEIGLEARLRYSLSASSHINVSLGGQHLVSQMRVANAFIPVLQHEVTTMRWTATTEAEVSLGTYATLEGGTRFTLIPSRQTVYAEPRLALRYDRSTDGVGDVALRLASGLYRQFTNQFDVSRDGATAVVPTAHVWLPVDHSLAPPRAYHLASEALWMPTDAWRVTLEAYGKWQPHLLAVDYPTLRSYTEETLPSATNLTQASFIAPSRGRAYGGGVRIAYETDALRSTLSYSYSDARRTVPHRFDGDLEPTPWNEPHRVTVNAEVPVVGGVSVQSRADGVWGRRWGFRQAYYDYLTPNRCSERGWSCTSPPEEGAAAPSTPYDDADGVFPPYDLRDPATHQLPPLLRVDAGLVFAQSWRGVHLRAQASLVNVLDRANVADWILRPVSGGRYERVSRTLPGRRPVFSLSLSY